MSDAIITKLVKRDVPHCFVTPKSDDNTLNFLRDTFVGWETGTFNAFETVKDKNAIAIDLGAWIGTTAIWLSSHFKHVIAVEADRKSVEYLVKNLEYSNCHNVDVCPQPIYCDTKMVTFGPNRFLGSTQLNMSTSYLTPAAGDERENDYRMQAITFADLVSKYALPNVPIRFIKCDIEGGEQYILQDLLRAVTTLGASLFLSFHLTWWQPENVSTLIQEATFEPFTAENFDNGRHNVRDVVTFIRQNPFGSLLFKRKE